MKIAILTHPLTENYGGIMQAVALYGYLVEQGHDVTLLRRHRNRAAWKSFLIFLLENVPFQNYKNYRYLSKKRKKQKEFIDKFIPSKTSVIYTTAQLKNAMQQERFDAVVVGSDQVWRMASIDDGYFENYFLNFVGDDIRKLSYAASFGVDHWEAPEKVDVVKELLKRFYAVSVREVSGVGICIDQFGRDDCELVVDPTLLVGCEFYDRFIDKAESGSGSSLLVYMLDSSSDRMSLVDYVAKKKGEGWVVNDVMVKSKILDVREWVNTFAKADFVITDSFHGMVFSIIFNKEFIVLANRRRGVARFSSLASMLGVEDRILYSADCDALNKCLVSKIDYELVNSVLVKKRNDSRSFLSSALEEK